LRSGCRPRSPVPDRSAQHTSLPEQP
jgi:hypothetical protein